MNKSIIHFISSNCKLKAIRILSGDFKAIWNDCLFVCLFHLLKLIYFSAIHWHIFASLLEAIKRKYELSDYSENV